MEKSPCEIDPLKPEDRFSQNEAQMTEAVVVNLDSDDDDYSHSMGFVLPFGLG